MNGIRLKTGWQRLEGVEKWMAELKILIEDARVAASKDDDGLRLEVAAYLAGYVQESYPQTAEMDKLDTMAQELARDLLKTTIDDRLAAIAARTVEFAKLEKSISSSANGAEAATDAIRLGNVTRLINAATEAITSARTLSDSLDASKATDKKITTLIDETVTAIERLRSAVAGLV